MGYKDERFAKLEEYKWVLEKDNPRGEKKVVGDDTLLLIFASALGRFGKYNSRNILLGPTYQVITSYGDPITTTVLAYDEWNYTAQGKNINDRHLFLIAQDKTGEIVGHTQEVLRDPLKEGDPVSASGLVVVREKNKGIGTALVLPAHHLFQNYADIQQKPVVHKAENMNQEQLDRLRAQTDPANPEQVSILNQKENEQSRWQYLFGPAGIFGYDQSGQRRFNPTSTQPSDVFSLEEVALERAVKYEGGRKLIEPAFAYERTTKSESLALRMRRLEEVLDQLQYMALRSNLVTTTTT